MKKNKQNTGPKVLLLDIETSPILAHVWGLWDQNVALNQIQKDWHVLSWSAKWLDDPPNKIMYADQRKAKNLEDDKVILKKMWKLLDEADIVITQNGIKFDIRKLNARFIQHGMKKPSEFKQIDTLRIAKKHFDFTSNKLEYMADKLCTKYKKLTEEREFSGFALWRECMKGNMKAWKEMEKYNKYDVLTLEELYHILQPWDKTINFNSYMDTDIPVCNCGSHKFQRRGVTVTSSGKFARYQCQDCGKWYQGNTNLLTKEEKAKRKTLLKPI